MPEFEVAGYGDGNVLTVSDRPDGDGDMELIVREDGREAYIYLGHDARAALVRHLLRYTEVVIDGSGT